MSDQKQASRRFAITEDLLKAVVDYLKQRPYQEVATAMPALLNLPEITINEDGSGRDHV